MVAIKLKVSFPLMTERKKKKKKSKPFRSPIPPKGNNNQSDALLLGLHSFHCILRFNCTHWNVGKVCGFKVMCFLQQMKNVKTDSKKKKKRQNET
jgi:hypothetical protein